MSASGACLLIHGYAGSPFEMDPLRQVLESAGVPVACPTLPGHGQTVEDLQQTRFHDWFEAVHAECRELRSRHGRVVAVGQSMGGSLGLALAEEQQLAGLVAIAAPVFLYRLWPPVAVDIRLVLLPFLKRLKPYWSTPPASKASRDIAPWKGYEGRQALWALDSFVEGLRQVRRDLPRVRCPLLVMHAPDDRLCPVESSFEILTRAGSDNKRLEMLNIKETITSRHVLTTHRETRDRVQRLVRNFVGKVLDTSS